VRITVIIKTLNEQHNIARAIESALCAVAQAGGGEVIVADSLSTDATVQIAARYPVRVVQLINPEDRCCGVGAQLGYTVAQGQYLYILDGDMTFEAGFLAAAADELDSNPRLGGVGGLVQEMHLANEEFVNRAQRGLKHMAAGIVDRLDMGGLYRRAALEQAGYFTNQNLHAYEEFELAARLAATGWQLKRLPRLGIRHYGHTETSFRLLRKRWLSRYVWGCGELLRQSLGKPHLGFVLRHLHVYRVYGAVLLWMLCVLMLMLLAVWHGSITYAGGAILVLLAPVLLMSWRRRSVGRGLYAVAAWVVFSTGLVAGVLGGRKRDPTMPVAHRVLQ
jgi:glycosyltransferase involved in cell wall biosynthesis